MKALAFNNLFRRIPRCVALPGRAGQMLCVALTLGVKPTALRHTGSSFPGVASSCQVQVRHNFPGEPSELTPARRLGHWGGLPGDLAPSHAYRPGILNSCETYGFVQGGYLLATSRLKRHQRGFHWIAGGGRWHRRFAASPSVRGPGQHRSGRRPLSTGDGGAGAPRRGHGTTHHAGRQRFRTLTVVESGLPQDNRPFLDLPDPHRMPSLRTSRAKAIPEVFLVAHPSNWVDCIIRGCRPMVRPIDSSSHASPMLRR